MNDVRNAGPRVALVAAVALIAGPALAGGFESDGFQLLSQIPLNGFASNPSGGNDCWGYTSPSGREYALMGIANAVAVVEVTDPANPVILAEIGHTSSLWGDVKVFGTYAYVTNESGGGTDVIDLSQVDAGIVTDLGSFGAATSHNVVINTDSGYLYYAGGPNGGRLTAHDLNANPVNPPLAGSVNATEGAYVHDAQVITYDSGPYAGLEIAFCCNGGTGFDIYDVTNKSNMFRRSRSTYAGLSYCHQGWITDDHQYFLLNDETDGVNQTVVFDVSDLDNPFVAATYTSGLSATDHNLYVKGDLVFEADYNAGLRVFDITDPLNAQPAGYFDSNPDTNGSGFNGAWSVYPYFESGTILISDIDRGLFCVRMAADLLDIAYPEGRPDLVNPAGQDIVIDLIELEPDSVVDGTAMLFYNDGSGWQQSPLVPSTGDSYIGSFGATECGSTVQWYVSVGTSDGFTVTDPGGAPTNTYSAFSAAEVIVALEDDFETNTGWTVVNEAIEDGPWDPNPSVPIGGGDRGDPANDFDGSGQCFLTDNVDGNSDLDGGPTRLLSPVYDLSGLVDPYIGYARWFTCDDGDDFLTVEISNNGGASWVEVEVIGDTAGWVEKSILVADFVAPSANVRMRFSAADQPNNSVTEAGLDAIRIFEVVCDDGGTCDITGDGVFNVDDLLAVLGSWGPCPGCPADINGDDQVNVDDLLVVLGSWGPCP